MRWQELNIDPSKVRGGKTICPKCSHNRKDKKDPCLSVDLQTGLFNCHNCGFKGCAKEFEKRDKVYIKPSQTIASTSALSDKSIQYFQNRGISKATLEKFMIFAKEEFMPQTGQQEKCLCFPYFKGDEIINIKFRSF